MKTEMSRDLNHAQSSPTLRGFGWIVAAFAYAIVVSWYVVANTSPEKWNPHGGSSIWRLVAWGATAGGWIAVGAVWLRRWAVAAAGFLGTLLVPWGLWVFG